MYTVTLSHARNPDVAGGYWSEPIESGKRRLLDVATLGDAAVACRAYIVRNGLGGGNWTGGKVTQKGKFVAKVSFNGRLWDSLDWQTQQEILPQEGPI